MLYLDMIWAKYDDSLILGEFQANIKMIPPTKHESSAVTSSRMLLRSPEASTHLRPHSSWTILGRRGHGRRPVHRVNHVYIYIYSTSLSFYF